MSCSVSLRGASFSGIASFALHFCPPPSPPPHSAPPTHLPPPSEFSRLVLSERHPPRVTPYCSSLPHNQTQGCLEIRSESLGAPPRPRSIPPLYTKPPTGSLRSLIVLPESPRLCSSICVTLRGSAPTLTLQRFQTETKGRPTVNVDVCGQQKGGV